MAKQGGTSRRYRGSAKQTRQGVGAAYATAAALGEIVTVKPSAYRVDHSPILRDGEAYVFPTGTVYHDAWCGVVAERWDETPARVLVTKIADVGQRTRCGKCDEPLGV